MENLHFIKFRNNQFFVKIINEVGSLFIFEDQNSFEEFIAPKAEVSFLASMTNGLFLTPDGDIFTISNSVIKGVFSRAEVQTLTFNPGEAIISITDPHSEKSLPSKFSFDGFSSFVEANNINIPILELQFSDIEEEIKDQVLFNIDHAVEIVDFIRDNRDKRFIIHCEAGISRSAAIAVIIEKILKLESNEPSVKDHIRFIPNSFIIQELNSILR